MASNASHMLEAALEQMDDIIAGKSFCFHYRYTAQFVIAGLHKTGPTHMIFFCYVYIVQGKK